MSRLSPPEIGAVRGVISRNRRKHVSTESRRGGMKPPGYSMFYTGRQRGTKNRSNRKKRGKMGDQIPGKTRGTRGLPQGWRGGVRDSAKKSGKQVDRRKKKVKEKRSNTSTSP